MKKVLFGMFLSLIAIFTLGTANAEEVAVEVPTVVMSAPSGSTDNFFVAFERESSDAPMPISENKISLTIKGNGEGKFGSITYTKEGLYKYRLYQ